MVSHSFFLCITYITYIRTYKLITKTHYVQKLITKTSFFYSFCINSVFVQFIQKLRFCTYVQFLYDGTHIKVYVTPLL